MKSLIQTACITVILLLLHAHAAAADWKPAPGPLQTRWTQAVTPDNDRSRVAVTVHAPRRTELDQGWWPDGLYTPPADEAIKYDIEMTKQFGMNITRKHVTYECTSCSAVTLSPDAVKTLRTGQNTLAIHCHQTGGGQYIDAGLSLVLEVSE